MKSKITKLLIVLSCFVLSLCVAVSVVLGIYLAQPSEVRYSGYGDAISPYAVATTETVSYTRKEVNYEETDNAVPIYSQSNTLPNSCGATAGAIILGFYDKYYGELIPNFDSYLPNGDYKRADKVYIPQLMNELYTLMRTNVDDVGVSKDDFLTGLNTYIKNQGRTITYSSILSFSRVNESSFTTALRNNKPTILFCSKLDLYTLTVGSNSDILTKAAYVGAHIAVAYGMYTVKYYSGTNNFRTDKYLKVASGFSEVTTGYLKIESTDWCNDALTVSIS